MLQRHENAHEHKQTAVSDIRQRQQEEAAARREENSLWHAAFGQRLANNVFPQPVSRRAWFRRCYAWAAIIIGLGAVTGCWLVFSMTWTPHPVPLVGGLLLPPSSMVGSTRT
jgi:hypothetical protein